MATPAQPHRDHRSESRTEPSAADGDEPSVLPAASSPALPVAAAVGPEAAAESPRRIIAIAFDSPLRAQEALLAALDLEARELLSVHDAVFVNRTAQGRVEIVETSDPSPVAAAVPTSLLGALIGTLIAGPIGLLVGGVLAGGSGALAARLIDTGIPDAIVQDLGGLIAPGHTALALLVSDVVGMAPIDELRRFRGARLVYAELPPEALAMLRQLLADPSA